jgi:hypothetical protein
VIRLVGVVTGQKGGQPLDGILEPRVIIDERTHPGRQPLDAELFAAAPVFKFLNATVGEIHLDSSPHKGPAPVPVGAEYCGHTVHRSPTHGAGERDTPGTG